MMHTYKISIIVPLYNAEKYLSRCIDSILSQNFTDFELLLINDGSIDESGKICDNYAKIDSRIRVFHKENGGVSSARNVGLKYSLGEWICFVDADDTVSPDWLSGFINYDKHPDLITHPVLFIYPNGDKKRIAYNSIHKNVEYTIWELYENHLLGFVWSMFYNRNTITTNDIKFNEKLQSGEDLEFMSRYSSFVTEIDSFFVGYYIYTFPKYNKIYGKARNVYFLIYSNLHNYFKSKQIQKKFIKAIAPNLIQFILRAYSWNEKEVANKCIKYYRKNVPTPFFLKSGGKTILLCNIFIKINIKSALFILSKMSNVNKNYNGFEYLELK